MVVAQLRVRRKAAKKQRKKEIDAILTLTLTLTLTLIEGDRRDLGVAGDGSSGPLATRRG